MNCSYTRSIVQGRVARGFFYMLLYHWSTLSSTVLPKLKCFHASSALSRLGLRHARKLSFKTCQHDSVRRPRDIEGDAANVISSEEPPLSSHLRKLMRTIPHSVVVATSTTPSHDHGTTTNFKGMTVSSFTTLTLAPSPIITFNIRQPSQTLTAISQSKQFFIHLLSATESGARVADAFTRGNRTSSEVFHNSAFSVLKRQSDPTAPSPEPPLLAAEGIIKVLSCELLEGKGLVEVGDHVLVLGKVLGIIEPDTKHEPQRVEKRGLCYLDRAYRQVGSVIELPERL